MSFEKMKEAIDSGLTIWIDVDDETGDVTRFSFDKHSVAYFINEGKPVCIDTPYEDIVEFIKEFEDFHWGVMSVEDTMEV